MFNVSPIGKIQTDFCLSILKLFRHSFRDNSNSFSLLFGLPIYKWSPVYLALAREILHWQMAQSKCLNEGMLVLSDLELHALPYIAPITAISQLPEY